MKKLSAILFTGLLLFTTLAVQGAQTAQARMYCISVRLSDGADEFFDSISISSTGTNLGVGELTNTLVEPMLPGTSSYASGMWLYDSLTTDNMPGTINISIAPPLDADSNRFPDFFEVTKAVHALQTNGVMDIPRYRVVEGVDVTWDRAARTNRGTCTIAMDDGYYGVFHHTFEILEYTGTLEYTTNGNSVSGTLNLTSTAPPYSPLQTTLTFLKTGNQPWNQLTLQPGSCSGPLVSTVSNYISHVFTRNPIWPTNYAGYIEFSDNDPGTYEPWNYWVLSITDTNDLDTDGIPDFSDPGDLPAPRQPELALVQGTNSVQLIIGGDTDHPHEIQETLSLSQPDWRTVQTVRLQSDPQTVTLPLPSSTTFWRVIAH